MESKPYPSQNQWCPPGRTSVEFCRGWKGQLHPHRRQIPIGMTGPRDPTILTDLQDHPTILQAARLHHQMDRFWAPTITQQ
jgi:hypothetical protein